MNNAGIIQKRKHEYQFKLNVITCPQVAPPVFLLLSHILLERGQPLYPGKKESILRIKLHRTCIIYSKKYQLQIFTELCVGKFIDFKKKVKHLVSVENISIELQ